MNNTRTLTAEAITRINRLYTAATSLSQRAQSYYLESNYARARRANAAASRLSRRAYSVLLDCTSDSEITRLCEIQAAARCARKAA